MTFFRTALHYLAQQMGVLMELGNLSVSSSVLLQQLLGAKCNGQQARLVQDLRGVLEATMTRG